jgi:HD-GYP domain-containing protein (c-di-GMP phosphodiesterase class II)
MKKVTIESILIGTKAEYNYYSDTDELLIGKGVLITEKHTLALQKRRIYELYIPLSTEDEYLHAMSIRMPSLDGLDFGGSSHPDGTEEKVPEDAIHITDLKQVKFGKEGLEQLLKSDVVFKIENSIKKGFKIDFPTGVALKSKAKQLKVGERTPVFLNDVSTLYRTGIEKTRFLLHSILSNEGTSYEDLEAIISEFTKIFLVDKNILLNIAATKPVRFDDYLYYHSLNVCILAINIAAAYGYSQIQILEIASGALLHDIGMLLISKEIRNKQGKFTNEEWYEVQKHPVFGLHILEKVHRIPPAVLFITYQIHERLNSKGYPKQRTDRFIHRYAKLVQIADVYEALTSPRPHRKAYVPYEAMDRIVKMVKTNMISGQFVKSFLTYMSYYPIGGLVQLNNACIAKVVESNEQALDKPVVSVLTNEQGLMLPKDRIYQINLLRQNEIKITEALSLSDHTNISPMDGF